jgi:cytochrome c
MVKLDGGQGALLNHPPKVKLKIISKSGVTDHVETASRPLRPRRAGRRRRQLRRGRRARRAQDVKHGQAVFNTNRAICHSTAPGRNVIGPSLHAVVGRKAGSAPGFNYSPALQASGVVWTPANLDSWLTSPRAVVPQTRMSFAGLHASADRADVIAFLAQQK